MDIIAKNAIQAHVELADTVHNVVKREKRLGMNPCKSKPEKAYFTGYGTIANKDSCPWKCEEDHFKTDEGTCRRCSNMECDMVSYLLT